MAETPRTGRAAIYERAFQLERELARTREALKYVLDTRNAVLYESDRPTEVCERIAAIRKEHGL